MSATIDTSMFAEYFGNCPIMEIEGRFFPVQGKGQVDVSPFYMPKNSKRYPAFSSYKQ